MTTIYPHDGAQAIKAALAGDSALRECAALKVALRTAVALVGDRELAADVAQPSLPSSTETLMTSFLLSLRARIGVCWDVGERAEWGRDRFAGASRRRAQADRSRARCGRGARPGVGRAAAAAAVHRGVQAADLAGGRRV